MEKPTPLVIGTNGYVAAYDRGTGTELWRTKLQSGFFGGRCDVAVILRDEFIFAGSAGHLFCLSLADGQIVWHNEMPGLGLNSISLAIDNVSIQYLPKVVQHSSSNATAT